MGNEKKLHTIIIGAGTTGLLVAQGLKKASLPYSLFEYETSTSYQTRPREWGMTMHWGSSHLASCLPPALAARISETYADPSMSADAVTGLPVHNGKTGELLMTMAGERPCRVSRRKLRKLFSEGLTIQYGKEFVEAVEEGEQVVAVFADGTRVVGDVLVGCDGARSRVREVVCGEEAARVTTVPVSMINFTQMYTAEQALHVRSLNPLFVTSIHPDLGVMFWLSIQDVPDPDKPETWTFQIFMSWMDNPIPETENNEAGRLAFVKRIAEQWAEPWKSAGLWVKEGTKIPIDSGTYWERAAPWDNRDGKMTLCGDAAHPMTPQDKDLTLRFRTHQPLRRLLRRRRAVLRVYLKLSKRTMKKCSNEGLGKCRFR